MKLEDIKQGSIFRAISPNKTNYQIEISKHKSVYKYGRVLSIRVHYEGGKNVKYIYFTPFNHWNSGLVSCRKLNEFKKEFRKLKFNN